MGRRLVIAIDGPSGVGKGTVARTVAGALGYTHIDTGVMYRAVGLRALRLGIDLGDEDALAQVARALALDMTGGRVVVEGEDVTSAIRTVEIDRAASAVALHPRVRKALVALQRLLGAEGGIVMEGRDIGTVVFPEADVKIYLDAAPEERGRPRAPGAPHTARGPPEHTPKPPQLEARDHQDSSRTASPLSVAEDATVIDTTTLPIPEVVARVMALIRARGPLS